MIVLVRKRCYGNSLFGSLYLNGAFICYTLENVAKAIPYGTYTLENSMSPKFKRVLPLIYGHLCEAKRGIRIHRGNTSKDSSGCVLVGMGVDYSKRKLTDSATAETMVTAIAEYNTYLLVTEGDSLYETEG